MTVPRQVRRVTDLVLDMFAQKRGALSGDETQLLPHLRGNTLLHEALTQLIKSRIEGRARLALPSDPNDCLASMARDKELIWLLSVLDRVYTAPIMQGNQGEQPEG